MYIYVPARLCRCDCHSPCHLRQVVLNFRCENKVTCHRIFVVEIWYRARMPRESIDWDHAHTCKALKANAKIMFLLPISKN